MDNFVMLEKCPICDGELRVVREAQDVRVGQRSVSLPIDHQSCSSCGERYLSPETAEEAHRRASATIRRAEGLLQPEEIRLIREHLGYTQAQFERLLGVGPKTVVRWERGTVFQHGATDTLLRVLAGVPAAARYLQQLRRALRPEDWRPAVADMRTLEAKVTYHYVATPEPEETRREPYPPPKESPSTVRVRVLERESSVYAEAIG